MSTYFPYSQIILTLCDSLKQSVSKHSFFGEWNVYETENHASTPDHLEISELYY